MDKFLRNAAISGDLQKETEFLTIVLSFNQKNFITECIESVLQQEIDSHHIVIHDDFSDDGTSEIVMNYYKKYPSLITVIQQNENKFSQGINIVSQIILRTNSQFIALCDGDDYWTDKFKIQKQKKILDKNSNYSLVFTNLEVIGTMQGEINAVATWYQGQLIKNIFTYTDLVRNNPFPKSSVAFRRDHLKLRYLKKMKKLKFSDWVLNAHILEKGDAFYLKEKMLAYRIHNNNMFAGSILSTRIEQEINQVILFMSIHCGEHQRKLYKLYLLDRMSNTCSNLKTRTKFRDQTILLNYYLKVFKYRFLYNSK